MAWTPGDDGWSEDVDNAYSFCRLNYLLLKDDKISDDERLEIKNRVEALDREYKDAIEEVCGLFFSGSSTQVTSPSCEMLGIMQTFWNDADRYDSRLFEQAKAIFKHTNGAPFKLGQMISLEPGELIFAKTLPEDRQHIPNVGPFGYFELFIRALADGEGPIDCSRGMDDASLRCADDVQHRVRFNALKHRVSSDICRMFTVVASTMTSRYQVSIVMHG